MGTTDTFDIPNDLWLTAEPPTPTDAHAADELSRRKGEEARVDVRARFTPLVAAIRDILEPTTTVKIRLQDVENAAVRERTGLASDDERMCYVGSARAQATYDAYDAVLTDFARWCAANGEGFVMPTPLALTNYFTDRAAKYAFGVLRRLLCALNALHAALHLNATDTTASWLVRQSLRGVGYQHGRAPKRRARAFVVEYLRAAHPWFVRFAQIDPLRATRNFALLALGIATDLRSHSLVALTTDDVTFHEQGVHVVARRSKTRRPNEQPHTIAVHAVPGSSICPVAALRAYVRTANLTSGYLFRGVRQGRLMDSVMTTMTVTNIVRQAVRATGLDLDERGFSSHSLRAGGITSAYERGAESPAIMAVSDHASVAQMMAYVRPEDPFKSNHTAGLFGDVV